MADPSEFPAPVSAALDRWVRCHDDLAPGLVEGLYVVGSLALGDWRPTSDIDIVAFTADPATDEDADALRRAHDAVAEARDVVIDGPYLAWGDVTVPPTSVHRPWTLDRQFHHDAECFETNPVTWFTLAEAGVAVRGEPPGLLGVYVDESDRVAWCRANLNSYWRSVHAEVTDALAADPSRREFSAAMTEWCVLGVARMAYTIDTGDVTSKRSAGRWAHGRYERHTDVLDLALQIRHAGEAEPVDRNAVSNAASWMEFVLSNET